MRENIAVICFDNPFLKPLEGGKKGMLANIMSFAALDASIDVFLLNKKSEGYCEEYLIKGDNINYFQVSMNSITKIVDLKYPICSNKRFVEEYIEIFKNRSYDVAFYHGEQVAIYRMKNIINAKKHVILMHDIESLYRKERANAIANPVRKILEQRESRKFAYVEKTLYKNFDYFFFVSKDEMNEFSKKYKVQDKSFYIPVAATQISKEISDCRTGNSFLYVGDLTIEHNFKSVSWFITEVLPGVLEVHPDIILKIVGKISEKNSKKLTDLSKNVIVLGYVDDLDKVYKDAICFIAPVLYGAGVKVKTIDAIGMGMLLFGTEKAIEGTDLVEGKHIVIAKNASSFTKNLIDFLSNGQKYFDIQIAGYEFIKEIHSIEYQSALLAKLLLKN